MPPLENEEVIGQQANADDDENRNEKTLSGPIIGIIYPPPEVRSILNLKKTQKQTPKKQTIPNVFVNFTAANSGFRLISLNQFTAPN